jgi:hypothetical protein
MVLFRARIINFSDAIFEFILSRYLVPLNTFLYLSDMFVQSALSKTHQRRKFTASKRPSIENTEPKYKMQCRERMHENIRESRPYIFLRMDCIIPPPLCLRGNAICGL